MEPTTSPEFVGRQAELSILEAAFRSREAELVAVIGRRRVGKTFLVRQAYRGKICFEMTGLQHGGKTEQLRNFSYQLAAFAGSDFPLEVPQDWQAAFQLLISYLKVKDLAQHRAVLFFDEIPWIATPKSGFLEAFGLFWNSWAVQQNLVIVICGSAASWMINKVVNHKGGLYNRITKRIFLKPFHLRETEEFLQRRGIRMDRYQLLQVYMAMGGIPHYLKELAPGKSAVQNIDDICFAENGLLNAEFDNLYLALFEAAERHVSIIRALAVVRSGLARKELLQAAGLSDGGGSSKVMEELISSGFITGYYDFKKKRRNIRYRLTDEYSLFFLKFIEPRRNEGRGTWQRLSQTQTWKSWSGYAYEGVCLKHIRQLKAAMGIDGLYAEASTFYQRGAAQLPGVQIDLLLDRNDHVINLFEIKFYNGSYVLDKATALAIRQKMGLFAAASNTRKQLQVTLVTTFPILENEHSRGLIDQALTMDDLFREVEV